MGKFKSSVSMLIILLPLVLIGIACNLAQPPIPTQTIAAPELKKLKINFEACDHLITNTEYSITADKLNDNDSNITYEWKAITTLDGESQTTGSFVPETGVNVNYKTQNVAELAVKIQVSAKKDAIEIASGEILCNVNAAIPVSTATIEIIPTATKSLNILIKSMTNTTTLGTADVTSGKLCYLNAATGSIDTNGYITLTGLKANREYVLSLNGQKPESASFNQVLCGQDKCPETKDHWDFMSVTTDSDGKVYQQLITYPFDMHFSLLESNVYNTKFFVKDKAAKYCIALGAYKFIFQVVPAP